MRRRWFLMMLMAMAVVGATSLVSRAADEEDGKEVKIKFSEAPEAVQKTLTAEARGAKIENVDKETKRDGTVVYEADAIIDGTNYEIQVDKDGKLISKKVDKEEDEKKDKDGKKEKKD